MISPEALEKARSLVANYGSDPDGLLVGAIAAALSLPDQPDAARAGVRELDDDQIMEIIKEVAPWRDEPKLNDLLTYEKSPPLFPQATYDVPSYRATKFVRAVERRILSALVSEPSPAQADDRGLLNICEADMKVSFVGDCPRASRSLSQEGGDARTPVHMCDLRAFSLALCSTRKNNRRKK